VRASLVACAATGLVLAVPAMAGAPAPALRLVAKDPLTVRGAHFKAHERVRVTAYVAAAKYSKRVRATTVGAFKVSFDVPTAFDPCVESLRITAVGARGSDAALKLPQRACPPAP
jgi:hypothetical protein